MFEFKKKIKNKRFKSLTKKCFKYNAGKKYKLHSQKEPKKL